VRAGDVRARGSPPNDVVPSDRDPTSTSRSWSEYPLSVKTTLDDFPSELFAQNVQQIPVVKAKHCLA
jgi:hypothetical protein